MGAVAKAPPFPGSKSAGLPFILDDKRTKAQAAEQSALDDIRKQWYDLVFKRQFDLAATACFARPPPLHTACFARSPICERDQNKIHATWGYPLHVNMCEGQFFFPLLEHIKQCHTPPIAYGLEILCGGMNHINEMVESLPGHYILMGHWTQFDKTTPVCLIRDAF